MKLKFYRRVIFSGFYISLALFVASCDLLKELDPESDTDKTVRIFTEGDVWKLDTLVTKTDILSGDISNVTSDSTFVNFGTIEFQKPNFTQPGYGAGYMIHRYVKNGVNKVDTAAWVPYNFNSTSNGVITLFFSLPGHDFVVGAYDMYLDLNTQEEKKIRFSGWRRETIYGGSGGSYGTYRRYHLTR